MPSPPQRLILHRGARELELVYDDGRRYRLPFEYLRVFSPSAEVRGHGGGEPVLVPGKRAVGIDRVAPVGSYAVRIEFDDGHNTGLYSWQVLHELALGRDANWSRYLERLAEHGMSRDSDVTKLSALPRKFNPNRS